MKGHQSIGTCQAHIVLAARTEFRRRLESLGMREEPAQGVDQNIADEKDPFLGLAFFPQVLNATGLGDEEEIRYGIG